VLFVKDCMEKTLKSIVEDQPLVKEGREMYKENIKPSSFAEMYMEEPIGIQGYFSPTVCTWRGIPTIDDF